MITTKPQEWVINHIPALSVIATVTKPAGGAGVSHVCTSITASVASDATASSIIIVRLRDGASGAGTVLWAATLRSGVNISKDIVLNGLCFIGSPNTAMTLEFNLVDANHQEIVALGGYSTS